MGEEGRLHRMQLGALGRQAFDGRDGPALDLGGKGEAGENALAIDMDRAGAALALVAALLRAGEVADARARHRAA